MQQGIREWRFTENIFPGRRLLRHSLRLAESLTNWRISSFVFMIIKYVGKTSREKEKEIEIQVVCTARAK